ncbi:hypothetical protein [Neobacillus bataviensis]|uniref:hypothetical protein n=1 Tax=Neobacillus bataviensis TaxID=220685 RepID=UPI001CBE8C8E|nr:hypothetical protein [Neobacillus bataviensis]
MGEEQNNPYEEYNLTGDWKLVMQFNFAVFQYNNEFVIIDNKDEYIARFCISNSGVIDFKKTNYDLNPKIDFNNKTIKIPIFTEYGEW